MTDESGPDAGPRATYQVLADELERAIAGMEPGAVVASEHDLIERHGVSRLTARAALQELEARWLVRRVRGAGTFVARRLDLRIGADVPHDTAELVRRSGGSTTCRLLGTRTRRPSAEVAAGLDLDADERVVTLTRAGRLDALDAWYDTTHLPAELVEGIAGRLGDGTVLARLLADEYGLRPAREWARAELVVAPADVASRLGLDQRRLVWRLDTCFADRSLGRPVLLAQAWLRPDVFRARLELGRA